MLLNSTDGVGKSLGHAPTIKLFQCLSTYNVATQAVATDGNAQDIQTTGGADCMINGKLVAALTGDAAYDISGGLQGTVWLTAQSYTGTAGSQKMMRSVDGRQYVCILDHTSAASNKPVSGDSWRTYWKESDSTATNAAGTVINNLSSAYFLVCADETGELSVWNAGPVQLDADKECIIPNFEEEVFCPVGIMLVDSDTDGWTLGNASTGVLTGLVTYYQLINTSVFPKFLR